VHAELFASGCHGGAVHFWSTTRPEEPLSSCHGHGHASNAHDSAVWGVEHPLGHLLASFSQDMHTKFWSRARPGEPRTAPRDEEEATERCGLRDSNSPLLLLR
ncbi:hypothetical protein EMIHUDRAFT_257356, partial [Emiliania huxleyi CCMP1516]